MYLEKVPTRKKKTPAEDSVGQKFGTLEVVEIFRRRRQGAQCRVACWCEEHVGKVLDQIKDLNGLRAGKTITCSGFRDKQDRGIRQQWNTHRGNCAKDGAVCASYLIFKEIVIRPCNLCGSDPKLKKSSRGEDFKSNSLDRIDCRKGYDDISNLQPLCSNCNYLKGKIENALFCPGGFMGTDFGAWSIEDRCKALRRSIEIYEKLANRTP